MGDHQLRNAAMATAPYEYKSTSAGDEGGSLYQEMLERQRMHRDFETYVHQKDAADSSEKTKEALLHVTGKSTLCTPTVKGTACTGVTQAMNNIRETRELSHNNFEDDNEMQRDALYEESEFAPELEDETYGDPLGISARHSPHGRGKTPKSPGSPFAATPADDGVKTSSHMNPSIPAEAQQAMDVAFGDAERLEFSHKRVSSYDPNTFHIESVVLKRDGTFEHRDAAEWYCWRNGEDAHDGWIYIQKGNYTITRSRHEYTLQLTATRLYDQESFEDQQKQYVGYLSEDVRLLTLAAVKNQGRRAGAHDASTVLTLGGATQKMTGNMWKPICSEFVYDYQYDRQSSKYS